MYVQQKTGREKISSNRGNFHSLIFPTERVREREGERGGGQRRSSQLYFVLIEPVYNNLNFIAVQGSFPKSITRKGALSVAVAGD